MADSGEAYSVLVVENKGKGRRQLVTSARTSIGSRAWRNPELSFEDGGQEGRVLCWRLGASTTRLGMRPELLTSRWPDHWEMRWSGTLDRTQRSKLLKITGGKIKHGRAKRIWGCTSMVWQSGTEGVADSSNRQHLWRCSRQAPPLAWWTTSQLILDLWW